MADILVTSPYRPFTMPSQFKAVFNGFIYCGTVDAVDPSNSQVQVYKVNEDGSRIPASQPLRTNAGGFLVYNGQPAKFVTDSNHSLLVMDSLGAQSWYSPDVGNIDPESAFEILSSYSQYTFSSVSKMKSGTTPGGAIVTLKIGDECFTGATRWRIGSNANGEFISSGVYAEPLSTICLDDWLIDPSIDCSATIKSIMVMASAFGIQRVYSRGGKTFKIENTTDLTGLNYIDLDFGWSVIIDNVQGFVPIALNRAKHTFIVYDNSGVRIRCINWMVHPSRATSSDPTIPDVLLWIGGQYLGEEVTTGAYVSDIVFQQTKAACMPIAILGESINFKAKNIDVYGDASYGINFEYGEPPVDPDVDPALTNGRHPHNCTVENFNGYNLLNCHGFLRVASCYNVTFKNCQGYNTKNFIYCYGGDRNISRVSENVRFVNCKSKIDEVVLTAVNNAVSIVIPNQDGSAGGVLPSWTNYDHTFQFDNCEFQNNTTLGSAGLRFFGNQGATTFNECIFKKSYYGASVSPSINPNYRSRFSLTFNNCIFDTNYQDLRIDGVDGVKVKGGKIKRQLSNSTLPQISIGAVDAANFTVIEDVFIGEQTRTNFVLDLVSGVGTMLRNNRFELYSVGDTAIRSTMVLHGDGNNSTNGALISLANTAKRIIGEPSTGFKETSGITGPSLDYEIADKWLVNSTLTTSSCINSKNGNELLFRGGTGGASLTINHNAGGTGRYINKSGTNDTVTGNAFSKRYVYVDGIWYEM